MKPTSPRGGDSVSVGFLFNLLGRTVTVVAGGVVSILLARHFQAETFGRWAVASVYATLVGTVVDGGLGRLLIRDVARDPPNAGASLGRVLKGRFALSAVVVPLALLAATRQVLDWRGWLLIVLLVIGRLITDLSGTFSSALYAFDRFRIPNLVETVRRTGMVVATGLILVTDLPIEFAGLATLLLALVGTPQIFRETRSVLTLDFSRPALENARDAFWFWVSGIFFWINGEIDQLMLSRLEGNRVTGIYAAAVRLAALFYIIPRAVNDTVIRRMFKSAKDGIGLNRQMNATVILLTAVGTSVGVLVFAHGTNLVTLVYGASYLDSGPVFSTYGLFLAIFFIRTAPSWYLSSSDRVPLVTAFLAFACLMNIGANLYWIPKYGAQGAAWSTLLSECVLAFLCIGTSILINGRKLLLAILLGSIPGLSVFGVEILAIERIHWIAVLLLGATTALASTGLLSYRLKQGWNPMGLLSDPASASQVPHPPEASDAS